MLKCRLNQQCNKAYYSAHLAISTVVHIATMICIILPMWLTQNYVKSNNDKCAFDTNRIHSNVWHWDFTLQDNLIKYIFNACMMNMHNAKLVVFTFIVNFIFSYALVLLMKQIVFVQELYTSFDGELGYCSF